jgi:hypothetical protein
VNRIEVCDKDARFIASSGNSSKVYVWNTLKQKPNLKNYHPKERYSAHISDLV